MNLISRFSLLFSLCVFGCLWSATALAECGGQTQCIGVGATPEAAALAHHNAALATFTLPFGNQVIATASAAQTIYVVAVTGPSGSEAVLGARTITGTDAADFSITGGTCAVQGPVHGGASCTLTVVFNPASVGAKTATLHVPLNPPACVGCVEERTVTLTGAGVLAPTRADPAADAGVVGLINAQTQAARRFSQTQIVNFQQRMETLHRSGQRPAVAPASTPSGFARGGFTQNADTTTNATTLALLSHALNLTTTGSTHLSYSSNAAGQTAGSATGIGFWLGGNVSFGTRDQTIDSDNLAFTTEGVSLGIDKRVSDRQVFGLGLGFAHDRTAIGAAGSNNKSEDFSIVAYDSYQPTTHLFIDTLLGYGTMEHDAHRYVLTASDFARSQREGQQWFGAITTGYEHRNDGLLLAPYARIDFAGGQLDQTTETGVGAEALTYFAQNLRALQLSLGLRVEAAHETRYGWALPYVRVEYRHDIEEDPTAALAYADALAGPRYAIAPLERSSDGALLVGVGSDFHLRGGLTLGVDYQALRSDGPDSSQAIRFWFAKDIDGKGLPNFSGDLSDSLFSNPVRVDAGYTWDDNVGRVSASADKLADNIYSLNVSQGANFSLGSHTRLLLSGVLGAEKFQRYEGLDRVYVGPHAEFQYRTSGAFTATTFALFARAALENSQSALREGHRSSVGVSARQALTEQMALFGALSSNNRAAKNSAVFDTQDYSARFNLDYRTGARSTLYLGGEYRRGDVVSSGALSNQSAASADVFAPDDAFAGAGYQAYRLPAATTLWTLGYNVQLGLRDSLDLFLRRAESVATEAPDYASLTGPYAGQTGPNETLRYVANQVGVGYLMRF